MTGSGFASSAGFAASSAGAADSSAGAAAASAGAAAASAGAASAGASPSATGAVWAGSVWAGSGSGSGCGAGAGAATGPTRWRISAALRRVSVENSVSVFMGASYTIRNGDASAYGTLGGDHPPTVPLAEAETSTETDTFAWM